jgi:hypothetical protein
MDPVCHRCGTSLRDSDGFCPHCGVPQILVEAPEVFSPQPALKTQGEMNGVQWRQGILSAVLVAVPVGILSALAGMSSIFVIAGGFATIALYRRRCAGFTDGRIGWRMGAVLGAASALIASATDGIRMVILRYALHHGAEIDAQFQTVAKQMAEQALRSNSGAMQQAPALVHAWANFWLSADGHAAIQLLTACLVSLGMILFAATGGAIAGRLLPARARAQRSL